MKILAHLPAHLSPSYQDQMSSVYDEVLAHVDQPGMDQYWKWILWWWKNHWLVYSIITLWNNIERDDKDNNFGILVHNNINHEESTI